MIISLLDFKKKISENLKKKKFKKIYILTGKNSFYAAGINKELSSIIKKVKFRIYFKKRNFPEVLELKKIISELNKFKPDLIIAIGGGAVLDYAKIANNISKVDGLKERIKQSKIKFKKRSFLIAIPTTAGSGAEVTPNAVLYIKNIKYSLEDTNLKPDKFFLVPDLILSCNYKLKAASGFDAIAQAVESLMSKKSNLKSVKFAILSLKLSLNNFLDFIKNPNPHNAKIMSKAANYAGKAIAISRTTAPHALSYPFTAHYGISHGQAVAITFDEVLKFNYGKKDKSTTRFNLNSRFKKLFKLTRTKSIYELVTFFKNIKVKTGLKVSNIKPTKGTINKILSEINAQRLKNNPVELEKNDLKKILFRSLK